MKQFTYLCVEMHISVLIWTLKNWNRVMIQFKEWKKYRESKYKDLLLLVKIKTIYIGRNAWKKYDTCEDEKQNKYRW